MSFDYQYLKDKDSTKLDLYYSALQASLQAASIAIGEIPAPDSSNRAIQEYRGKVWDIIGPILQKDHKAQLLANLPDFADSHLHEHRGWLKANAVTIYARHHSQDLSLLDFAQGIENTSSDSHVREWSIVRIALQRLIDQCKPKTKDQALQRVALETFKFYKTHCPKGTISELCKSITEQWQILQLDSYSPTRQKALRILIGAINYTAQTDAWLTPERVCYHIERAPLEHLRKWSSEKQFANKYQETPRSQ